MYHPLVSIVIPVYKGGEYMREAIDSALAQTYDNIEIIVVNDGSPDDGETERIALEYGDKIRYFHKENGGCASALNFGISKMRGEWFSWLSHDDVYLPDKVKTEVDIVITNGYDSENTVIACAMEVIDSKGNRIYRPVKQEKMFLNSKQMFEYLFLKGTFGGCGLLIPKKVLDKVGEFDVDFKYILDWEYWIRMAMEGVNLYATDKKLVKNRMHKNQVTVRYSNVQRAEAKMLACKLIKKFIAEKKFEEMKILYNYSYARGLKEEAGILKKHLKANNKISNIEIARSKIYQIKKNALKVVKFVYKSVVRKAMKD